MILNKLQIINYKSCNNLFLTFDKDKPSILIGINDSGKSTILKAIGLLLSEKEKFNFVQDDKVKKDLSNQVLSPESFKDICKLHNIPEISYSATACYILGEFTIEESDYIQEISTHLQWVLDKPDVTKIWLCRTFDNAIQSSQYLLLTPRGIEDINEYYKEKATELKKVAKEKGVDKIENENKVGRYTTLEILRSVMNSMNLKQSWVEYKFDKAFFPEYRYLDWNISMEQLTQFTKDTMQKKIETELNDAKNYANDKRKLAQEKINNELDVFTTDFLKDVPSIKKLKANIYFDVEPRITDFIINKTNCVGDIHIESQGEGIKRQIWFSLIKWNALNAIQDDNKDKKFIWCFDEPETHLYPLAQRDFYSTIKKTSAANVQTIISTHSTIFVDKTEIKSIYKIDLDKGFTNLSKCDSIDDIFESLRLKNSDFLFYDKFIVVEGDTEEVLIPHFYKLVNQETLENDNIKIINLGGKNKVVQNTAILEGILGEFRKTESSIYYILDNDASFKLSSEQTKKYNITFVGKQDIEDSLDTSVWIDLMNARLEDQLRLSMEEINNIKDLISADKEVSSNKKFYLHLASNIRKKLKNLGRDDYHVIDDALPSKGSESGIVLSEFIKTEEQLPEKLINKLKEIKASS